MTDALFNPLLPCYKSVTGAIESGRSVVFGLETSKELAADAVTLRVFDCEGKETVFSMESSELYMHRGYDYFVAEISVDKLGTYTYHFSLISGEKTLFVGRNADGLGGLSDEPESWILNVYKRRYKQPFGVKGIMYHIFVDRFCSVGSVEPKDGARLRMDWGNMPEYKPDEITGEVLNNDFFGGNLKGITSKLPYLYKLGVSVIYLSPIFEAYSNHKYDVGNYERIDPMFGTEEDFTELCREAEKLGMRIILDGVFNHTGSSSRYFDKSDKYKDGAYKHKTSPYRDWYLFDKDGKYECWWSFETLPKLNPDSSSLRAYLCGNGGIVERWLEKGASGWRLDVVDELRDDVLDDIVKAAKRKKADALVIGEVWEDASTKFSYGKRRRYLCGEQLDSVMNYPLRSAIIEFVRNGNERAIYGVDFEILNNYPIEVRNRLMNFLGTHDTERILTALGGDTTGLLDRESQMRYRMTFEQLEYAKELLKLAAVLLYTHYGFPSVYYGDEAGVQGCRDPFNRTCFPWESIDGELKDFFVKLGKIRVENSAFEDGDFRIYRVEKGFYSYVRRNREQELVIAVNRGNNTVTLNINGAEDLLSGKKYTSVVEIDRASAVILKLDSH